MGEGLGSGTRPSRSQILALSRASVSPRVGYTAIHLRLLAYNMEMIVVSWGYGEDGMRECTYVFSSCQQRMQHFYLIGTRPADTQTRASQGQRTQQRWFHVVTAEGVSAPPDGQPEQRRPSSRGPTWAAGASVHTTAAPPPAPSLVTSAQPLQWAVRGRFYTMETSKRYQSGASVLED